MCVTLRALTHSLIHSQVLMATCHDLVVMGEEVKGHPVDLALFEAGGWTLNQVRC